MTEAHKARRSLDGFRRRCAGEPCPAVIVQDDRFDATASVAVSTVSKDRLGTQIGHLDDEDMVRLNRAILVFLGLA
jgi:mRNA interferase MazF